MYIIGNLLNSIAIIADMVLTLYMWIIIIRSLLTWVNPDPYNPIVRVLHQVTEPAFYQVRKYLPLSGGGIDLSPIAIIFAIIFLQSFLIKTMKDIAMQLQ